MFFSKRYGRLIATIIIIIVFWSAGLLVNAASGLTANFLEDNMIKPGVKLLGVRPELIVGLMACQSIYQRHGIDFVITSVRDGKHSHNSLHYSGQAADLRTRQMSKGTAKQIVAEISTAVGNQFDVILESNHIHIEFQPHTWR